MALPPEIGDREQQKFVEDDFGNVAVRVQPTNVNALSVGNSSTTELGISATFTGVWVDVSSFPSVFVTGQIDVPGGTVVFQWSDDGSTIQLEERYDVRDGIPRNLRSTVKKRYYRTVYDNGPNKQVNFSLNTFFGDIPAPSNDTMSIGDAEDNVVNIAYEDGIHKFATKDATTVNLLIDMLSEIRTQTDLLKQILE